VSDHAHERFGHREHLHLAWSAVREHGLARAVDAVDDTIKTMTSRAGRPQKYHATVSRAWVEIVAHHLDPARPGDFDQVLRLHPRLLDKRLLAAHYRSSTLASRQARRTWVPPDLAPFPWSHD
jgi:hypothetical protein